MALSQDMKKPLTWIDCFFNIEYDKVSLLNLFLSMVKEAPNNEKINIPILLKNLIWLLKNSNVTCLSKGQTCLLIQNQIA